MRQGFIFNLNKCVGCQACVVACQIENEDEQHMPWREVTSFNTFQHPNLPVFHYSLACNHCDDAPCMSSCPAIAYTRDEGLNTIVHHADRCIGCKYCTWACPYDAPVFVSSMGVVEKCTSCQHRLEEGKKPACTNLCPTGALAYGDVTPKEQSRIPGFTEVGVGPGIEIIPLKKRTPPRSILTIAPDEEKQFEKLAHQNVSKINLKQEWVLVIFTMLVPIMTGMMAAISFGRMNFPPWIFVFAGILGLILSSLHLGKKHNAWRSILNIKNSWLSREILGYGLFLVTSVVFFLYPEIQYAGYLSTLLGFATCYFIDKVYTHMDKTTRLDIQSNSVFLTALLLTSLLMANYMFAWVVVSLKILLYLYRKIYFIIHGNKLPPAPIFFRISIGFIVPIILWYSTNVASHWILIAILAGEIIDRLEFYAEGEIITPKRQMMKDMGMLLP